MSRPDNASTYLWLQVSVYVPQFVQLVDSSKHLCGIQSSVLFFKYARVVEQRTEVSSRDVFLGLISHAGYELSDGITHHCEVDMFLVLESVEQFDEPRRLYGTQNVSLNQYVLDLVHLGQSALSHLLKSAYFVGIDLSGEVNRSITSLSDLCDDSELVDLELRTALSQQDSLSATVGAILFGVLFIGDLLGLSATSTHATQSRSPLA